MTLSAPARTAAAAIAALLVLTGCSAVNPITTQFDYAASDGSQAFIGDVKAQNLLIIASGEGEPAALIGSLTNSGTEDVTVSFTFDGATVTEVTVPGLDPMVVSTARTVRLGPGDDEVLVTGTAPVMPGLLAEVAFTSEATGTATVRVPVMDGTLEEYADVMENIPALPAPSPSPEPSPAGEGDVEITTRDDEAPVLPEDESEDPGDA